MEWIKSIAPVLAAGAVTVIMVLAIKKKRSANDNEETYMAEGIALGLCLGAGVGASIPGALSYFISLGTLLGFFIGNQIKK